MDFDNSKIAQAKTENEILFEDPKNARKRRRADKRRRKKYKFTDKKHSGLGMISSVLAMFSLAFVIVAIDLSTQLKGQGGVIVGYLPFASLIFSSIGIVLSGVTFRKPDTIFTFSWIGLIANLVIWLFDAFILVIGI